MDVNVQPWKSSDIQREAHLKKNIDLIIEKTFL
jgi:hypothetical protein